MAPFFGISILPLNVAPSAIATFGEGLNIINNASSTYPSDHSLDGFAYDPSLSTGAAFWRNTFITHTSELLALPGFGRENYKKIAPYVTALPADEPLNVCTASGLVLDAALNQNTTQYANQDMALNREKGCWPEERDYTVVIADPTQKTEVEQRVDEKSSWFRLRTQVRIGTAEFVLYSVLFREPNGNKIRTVQRSFGSE